MLYDVENHYAAQVQGLPAALDWPTPEVVRPRPVPAHYIGFQLFIKRVLDVVVALLMLVALSPLLIAVAIAIRISDGPRVIYTQQRYGRFATPFRILKFRTMRHERPGEGFLQATHNDPRVTPLGALLRRTSIDELPQLINVILGHMSLVGPRPHAIEMEEDNFRLYPRAVRRLTMRPGMTGLAQIRGLRGPTGSRPLLRARLEADVEYVAGWTLWRDIEILLHTPAAWFLGKNAH